MCEHCMLFWHRVVEGKVDTYACSKQHELVMPGIHVKHTYTHKVPYPVLIMMVVVGQARIPLQLCHFTGLLEVKGLQGDI